LGGRFMGVPNVFSYLTFMLLIIIIIKTRAIECNIPDIIIDVPIAADIKFKFSRLPKYVILNNTQDTFTINNK
jgi:hypothetical protein